jgi:hypothetical protein
LTGPTVSVPDGDGNARQALAAHNRRGLPWSLVAAYTPQLEGARIEVVLVIESGSAM